MQRTTAHRHWSDTLIVCGCTAFVLIAMIVPRIVWASDMAAESRVFVELEEVVVTATRVQTPKQDVAANITVITAEDMKKIPASSAAEVLQYIPGVYVEFNGGLGSDASGIRIQGSEIRHVAIFQDNVPLNQLANPMTDLSYIPVDTIERIEIYKGAASSAWGSSLGGVINIITKDPELKKPFASDVRTSYGEYETSKSRGTFSGTKDRFGYLLSLTHEQSNGFIRHTQYQQDAVYAKINYDLGRASRLNFVYSYDKGRNEDPCLNWPDFWDDMDSKRTYQRLLFETTPADNLVLTVEGRHHEFERTIDDVYPDRREIYNDYQDEIWGTSARINWEMTDSNTLNLGFDGDWGEYDWANYTKTYETGNWAVYSNDTLALGNVTVTAGVRYDDNREFDSEVSPSCGVVYRFPWADALVRAQVARGFSAPPAAWVHDPQYGNPDLEPEIAVNYQLGGQVRVFKLLKLELNLFRADVEDLIRYDWDTSRYENIDEVRRQGVEWNVSSTFDFGLTVSFGASYVEVKNEETHDEIRDIPKTMYNASAVYVYKCMTHSVIGKYIDHNSTYPETEDRVYIFDYLLKVNLPFLKKYGKASMFGAVYNLFNSKYLYREVWPKPDRWIEGGVRFEF
ncbi:MAG: vitamin B12 transporter [Desulfobacteraceae bacterium Eth-SRB2]|nr:MAG: vitamin B12 transporter [Desulfobacteraceae bacterium Eth-SRB2]